MPIDLASKYSYIKKIRIFESENFIFFIGTHSLLKTLYYLTIKKIKFDAENKTLASSFTLNDIVEEQTEPYDKTTLQDLLSMLTKKHHQTLKFVDEVYCFFGFFKLYLGYYVILISECSRVGKIGRHVANRVERVKYYPLFTIDNLLQDNVYSLENKYLTLVKNFDFTKQVYFSYSYDITKTLQRNFVENLKKEIIPDFDKNFHMPHDKEKEKEVVPKEKDKADYKEKNNGKLNKKISNLNLGQRFKNSNKEVHFSDFSPIRNNKKIIANTPLVLNTYDKNKIIQKTTKKILMPSYDLNKCTCEHFLWNHFHIKEIFQLLQNKMWIVYFIYGFFEQVECNIFGLRLLVSVIARRNRHFAGTRYLKRGISNDGNVANDVETEQILEEITTTWTEQPIISSFIHIRGSVPIYWYQEHNSILPKPNIQVNLTDIRFDATKRHFAKLTKRYGYPCIVCNLTKKYEHQDRKQETLLNEWYSTGVDYINMTSKCDPTKKIIYHHYDLKSERRQPKFYKVYYDYSCQFIAKTNIFCFIPYLKNQNVYHLSLQNGVIRSNCIDCLDRTNVYQQVIGLAVMVVQLRQMGVKATLPENENEGIYGVLTEIYKRMGHELSTQYAGSLAHRQSIKDTRSAVNKFIDKFPEIFNSCKRYFNNSFNDQHKQSTINLFLGKYKVNTGLPQIWDMYYDTQLHKTDDLPQLVPDWPEEYYQEYSTFNLIDNIIEAHQHNINLIAEITIEKYDKQRSSEYHWEQFDSDGKECLEKEFIFSSLSDYLISFNNYIDYKKEHYKEYEEEILFSKDVLLFFFLDIDHKIQIKNFINFDYHISSLSKNNNNNNNNNNDFKCMTKVMSVNQLHKTNRLKDFTNVNTNLLSEIFKEHNLNFHGARMGELLRHAAFKEKRRHLYQYNSAKYNSPRSFEQRLEAPKYNLKITSFQMDGNDYNKINTFVHPDINYIQNSEYSLVDTFVSANINFNTYHEFLDEKPDLTEDSNIDNKGLDYLDNEFADDLNAMFTNLSKKKNQKREEENEDNDYFIYSVNEKCFYKKVKQLANSSMRLSNSTIKTNTGMNPTQVAVTGMIRDASPKAKVKMVRLPLDVVDHYY